MTRKNEVGERFGSVTVTKLIGVSRLRCWGRCECGDESLYRLRDLTLGLCTRCKRCRSNLEREDVVVGAQYGRLTITKLVRNGGQQQVAARCECGFEDVYPTRNIVRGGRRQCRLCSNQAARRPGISLGDRSGTRTVERIDGHRLWARCHCGALWFGHRSAWKGLERCECSKPASPARAKPASPARAKPVERGTTLAEPEAKTVAKTVAEQAPELSNEQARVLRAIERSLSERGHPPSLGELQDAVQLRGEPLVPVGLHLVQLQRLGFIERSDTIVRSIKVLRSIAEPGN